MHWMTERSKRVGGMSPRRRSGGRRPSPGWRIVAGVGLACSALACVAGCSGRESEARIRDAEERLSSQAILVKGSDVAVAARERLEAGISFTGELVPLDVVTVNARFDGDLEKVMVREGDRVLRNQSMAVFKPRDVRNARATAEAGLLAAKAALLTAENGERRARRLLEAGAAAPSDLEAAEAARAAADAEVRAALARLDLAREDEEMASVPAPFTGWVSEVMTHPGDHKAVGDPLLTLVRRDTLELSATIPSEALGRVRIGSPIFVRLDAFPGEVFSGTLDRINPTTEPGTRQVRIYARVPNLDGKLLGGLFASGRVVEEVREDAVVVPARVLRREGPDQVLYRLRDGTAQRLRVDTGLIDEQRGLIEALGAVEAGDSLLSGVVPGLRDGSRVRVLENGNAGSDPSAGGTSGR